MSNIKNEKTICPMCDKITEIEICEKEYEAVYKGEIIKYNCKFLHCPICDTDFENGELLNENLKAVKDKYAKSNYVFDEEEFKARKALSNIRIDESCDEIAQSMANKEAIDKSAKKYGKYIKRSNKNERNIYKRKGYA